MIVDATPQSGKKWHAEICIVGSGIVGLAVLKELLSSGRSVIVLEKGGHSMESEKEELKECEITGHVFIGHQEGRVQIFGGTSHTWGGQALPLDDSDMLSRPWLNLEGWPLQMSALQEYIQDADDFLHVSQISYKYDIDALRKQSSTSIDNTLLKYHFSKWSRKPNRSGEIWERVSRLNHVNVLEHATAFNIIMHDNLKAVSHIQFKDKDSCIAEVYAKEFVLCMGGLENPRLLLLSNTQIRAGIGNQNGHVGKFFQDHPTAQVGTVIPVNEVRLQQKFNYFFHQGTRMLPRLSLSPIAQQNNSSLSATAFIQFITDQQSLFTDIREITRFLRRRRLPPMRLVTASIYKVRQLNPLLKSLKEFIVRNRLYTPDAIPRLTVMIEQEPETQSRVELTETLDSLGVPKARIHWQISEKTVETFRVFCRIIEQELTRTGFGSISWDHWVSGSNATIIDNLTEAFHHMGTTRMSASPESGVVDPMCKVHGQSNLYVLGSSVFPTSGHSNPTLTAIALAIRCARHLGTAGSSKYQVQA